MSLFKKLFYALIKGKNSKSETYIDHNFTSGTLKKEAIKGGAISFITRMVSTLIQIVGVAVLARLLTPDDFGLVAMAAVVSGILTVFKDVGLTDATIQAPEIKHDAISTLFWINLTIGSIIAIILIAISPVVAWFFKRQQLTLIMIVSSVSYVFFALSVQHIALLKRNMLFFKVNLIFILAAIFSTIASIVLALFGFRYWAIVFRDILSSIITFILAWIFCGWRPGFPKKDSGAWPLIKFGVNSVGFYLVNYFANNMDNALIGKKFGSEQLGFYSRAYYMATTPSGQLSLSLFHVATSTLSKLRSDKDKYQKYYLNAISIISFIGMPMSVAMIILSKELVLILLGPQWNQAAELFSILGLAAGMNIIYSTYGWLHVSLGRADRWLKWGIIGSSIMVASFVIGLFFGAKGVAWGFTSSTLLLTFPGILYAGRPIGLRLQHVLLSIWKNTLAAAIAGLLIASIKGLFFTEVTLLLRICILLIAYIGSYLSTLMILNRGITPIKEYISLLKIILSRA